MGSKSYKMDKVKKFVAVFPGQASQYVGMGKDFIDNVEGSAGIIKLGEKITSLPLMDKIMSGPMEELTRTLFCQPAIFGISMISWKVFKDKGFSPCSLAGHSQGEYSALAASKAITIEEGFYLLKKRAQIMDEISKNVDGKLLAIIGLQLNDVKNLLFDFPGIEISNINSHKQTVVGGKKEEIEKISSFLRDRKIKGIMLNVSGPFHTSLMEKSSEKLKAEIERINFNEPEIPVYPNYSARSTRDKEEIKEGLIKQICSPVRWVETIENVVSDEGTNVFVEVGPKKVLKKLIEGIIPESLVLNVEDMRSLENTMALLKE
jgi:[acyl-carrier-protein] S-malonyltransferase